MLLQMITGIIITALMKLLYKVKHIGKQMINNIFINTVVPVFFAYGLHHNEQAYKDKAIKWLEEISAEKNIITKGFEMLNFSNKNAFRFPIFYPA